MENDLSTENRLAPLFRDAYEAMRRRTYIQISQRGFPDIRPSHSAVLRNVALGGTRVVDLAERAGMTKQSMAYLVGSLGRLGYVTLGPDRTDGRAKLVSLTKQGEKAVDVLTMLSLAAEKDLIIILGSAKIDQLRTLMSELLTALQEPSAELGLVDPGGTCGAGVKTSG